MSDKENLTEQSEQNPVKHYKTIVIIWICLIALTVVWNTISSRSSRENQALLTSRNLFQQIVTMRRWNAFHGGVYVPETDVTQPNPYLEIPDRDLDINDSLTLTKINPAYMTRQISEMMKSQQGFQFHITSLNPLRPENVPTDIEESALKTFYNNEKEAWTILKEKEGDTFFYMAPLFADESCLKCHDNLGKQVGDIQGGIGVYLPMPPRFHIFEILSTTAFVCVGVLGFLAMRKFKMTVNDAYGIIQKQAIKDPLTGLYNRRYFTEKTQNEIKRIYRSQETLALVMFDIDHFKKINDMYGHQAGDYCLIEVAELLKNSLRRPADFCARYGGEEFVMVLPEVDLEGVARFIEDLRISIEKHIFKPEEQDLHLTISAGICFYDPALGLKEIDPIIKAADSALYQAKEAGRNRIISIHVN